MKKIKSFILVLIITLSFLLGVGEIKALQRCDLSFYNAEIIGANDTGDDITCGENELCAKYCPKGSLVCLDTGRTDWVSGERTAAASLNVSDNNTITSWSMTIYESHGDGSTPAACTYSETLNSSPGKDALVEIKFGKNKKDSNGDWIYGHIYTVHFSGTYKDENGQTHSFNSDHVTISKEGQYYTTDRTPKTTTKPGETTTARNVEDVGEDDKEFHGGGAHRTTLNPDDENAVTNTSSACETVGDLFDEYWPYVMVIIPILLIIMITIDFFKALASNDSDILRKAGTNTVKRTIAAVLLLALPALISIIFDQFGIDICL